MKHEERCAIKPKPGDILKQAGLSTILGTTVQYNGTAKKSVLGIYLISRTLQYMRFANDPAQTVRCRSVLQHFKPMTPAAPTAKTA